MVTETSRSPEEYIEEDYIPELRKEGDAYRNSDPCIAAFCDASEAVLRSSPQYQEFVGEVYQRRREKYAAPAYLIKLQLSAFQELCYFSKHKDGDKQYPEEFTAEHWVDVIDKTTRLDTIERDHLYYVVNYWELSSNVSDRATGIALIIESGKERWGEQPDICDVGCSENLIPKRLALPSKVVRVGKYIGHYLYRLNVDEVVATVDSFSDDRKLIVPTPTQINSILSKDQSFINQGVGIDVVDPRKDPAIRKWTAACSFYPSELLNELLRIKYSNLVAEQPKNVSFFKCDFTEFDDTAANDMQSEVGIKQFDLVFASTMLYQLDDKSRALVLKNMRSLVKPGGLIVVQDFADADPNSPNGLRFQPNWFGTKWTYVTNVLDPYDSNGQFQEAFRFETGRCKSIQFGPAIGQMATEETIRLNLKAA